MPLLENEILELFIQKKKTLSAAESCTGGGLSKRVVEVPNASKYFLGSIVAYSNEAKTDLLKVSKKRIEKFGAVSQEVALEMALGAKRAFRTDVAIAITGIAGPSGGTLEKPVGMVCFAIVSARDEVVWTTGFMGGRHKIMEEAITEALFRLKIAISN